jgi:hypothetical protein
LPGNNVGLARLRVPRWVWEGLPDFVAIENREPFEQLRDALGDQPVDIPMMTYFIEKKGWTVDQLLQTRLTEDEAVKIMRANVCDEFYLRLMSPA